MNTNIEIIKPGSVSYNTWKSVYSGHHIALNETSWTNIQNSMKTVEQILANKQAVYGINTGFGKLANVRISDSELGKLQYNLIVSHATGVGTPLSKPVTRLMMAMKIASLSRGASGIHPKTIERLLQMLEQDLIPVIPGQGSVGASGDLAPLSHMAACLIGEGYIWKNNQPVPSLNILKEHHLDPIVLGPKEGLALINGTQTSCALALSAIFEIETLFLNTIIAGALSIEAVKGSKAPFDSRIHALRGHQSQSDIAYVIQKLLKDSEIMDSHQTCEKVQDPYSLRCIPQVLGACLKIIRNSTETLITEANGVSDNPLVFTDTKEVISGGNFHAEPVAFAADILALAICEIGALSERRIAMLTDSSISQLPAFLTPNPGLNSGFMIAHVTAAALVSENKQRAMPASVDSLPTSANQEDHVSMATHAARRLHDMIENAAGIIAIELLSAAQGIEFHRPLKSSKVLEAIHKTIRQSALAYDQDRYFSPDIEAVKSLVLTGKLVEHLPKECLKMLLFK